MTDIQNANPTILSAAQLPTRESERKKKKPLTAIDIFYKENPTLDPDYKPPDADSVLRPDFKDYCDWWSDNGDDEEHRREYEHPIDEQEIYDLIAPIQDPEHPLTLGSLSVVNLPDISIKALQPASAIQIVTVLVTPTITHCSLATVIGLGVRVRLEKTLPRNFRVDVRIKEGSHSTADQVNRQLADKERVAAAMENETLMGVLNKMLEGCEGLARSDASEVDQDEGHADDMQERAWS